jgi:hypothetical protein
MKLVVGRPVPVSVPETAQVFLQIIISRRPLFRFQIGLIAVIRIIRIRDFIALLKLGVRNVALETLYHVIGLFHTVGGIDEIHVRIDVHADPVGRRQGRRKIVFFFWLKFS